MDVQKVYFMVMVQDTDRAVAFYNEVMGLELKLHSRTSSELGNDHAVVALHAGDNGEYRITGLDFTVADLAAACEDVSAGCGRIINPPEERTGEGIILARVADSEGNGFSLTQRAHNGSGLR